MMVPAHEGAPVSAANYRLVRGLLLVFLGLWLLLTLFPFYWQIITALKDAAETNRTVPTFWPEVWHPGNFKLVFAEASRTSRPSSTASSSRPGIPSRRWCWGPSPATPSPGFRGRRAARTSPSGSSRTGCFPPVAVLIPMFFLFDATPWGTDSHLSLIILYLVFNMPLATWLMMVFFRDAPRELEEAAYLDGYPPLRAFFKVTLPLVLPGMISVAMLCWIFAWNEYLFANLFVGTEVKTFTIVIPTFTHGSQTLWNLQMAFSLIAMLPPLVLFVVLRRYMVRGLSLGVVKG